MNKNRISAVSFLNARPFLYGFELSGILKEIELFLETPSVCAQQLLNNESDIGLIPISTLPLLKDPHIISDYCIGTEGPVKTVCLFSQKPIHEVDRILLDYQSESSIQLLKILLKELWNVDPELFLGVKDFEQQIKEHTAGLIIGDHAISYQDSFEYAYDLGKAWVDHTGYPFVFAAWVSNKLISRAFIQQFNEAIKFGIDHIDKVILNEKVHFSNNSIDIEHYFKNNISYELDKRKQKGMKLFLEKATNYNFIEKQVFAIQ